MAVIEEEILVNLEEQVVDESFGDTSVVPPVRYDIASYGADYDVEGLVKRLNRGDIFIPPFQRNYVWTLFEASRFVESLLLGLPVPGVFLAKEPDSNKLLVIDGQQRLKSLQFFYSGFFNPKDSEKRKQVFRLQKVQKRFEGLTYETLEEQDRVELNDSIIHATVIRQESPADGDTSVYHIFERLNSEGRILTPQEIRTTIDHGVFIDMIAHLNEYDVWRDIYGKPSPRLKDQEMILRFLAFYFAATEYERPMKEFLDKFTGKHRSANAEFLDAAETVFKKTIDIVGLSIGNKAFRPIGPLNAAVFDSVMVGIARRLDKSEVENLDSIKAAYEHLIQDPEYQVLVSQSTSDEKNVSSRLEKATTVFDSI